MAIVKFLLSLVILSILYKRMIGRDRPAQIGKKQAVVPVLIHTCYDMCTANNKYLDSTEEELQLVGLILGILAAVLGIVFEVMVFVKAKKDAAKYCEMLTAAFITTHNIF